MILLRLAAFAVTACLVSASSVARNPLQFLGVLESPNIQTPKHRVHAHSSFDLSLDLYKGLRRIRLSLEPNHDIIPEGATISYLSPEGSIHSQEPILRSDHKVFRGSAKIQAGDDSWHTVGWARILVLRDGPEPLFEGAFSIYHDNHHIQLSSHYMNSRHSQDPEIELDDEEYMVVWRDSDVSSHTPSLEVITGFKRSLPDLTCASDDLEFNNWPGHPVYNSVLRKEESTWGVMPLGNLFGKRQIDTQPGNGNQAGVNLVQTIGQTQGCPNTRKVALVGVATDCTYTGTFSDKESTRSNVINQMNSASSLWESSFNISLGLQNLTISDPSCPGTPSQATEWNQRCSGDVDIQKRLNMFSQWRGTLVDHNSHWTLLTNCNTGSAVGLAWLGQACNQQSHSSNATEGGGDETVTGANIVAKTPAEWQVISHETGHTYGAVHDCTDQTCAQPNVVNSQQCCPLSASTCDAGEQYIMNPFTTNRNTHFSPCSIGNICSGIGRNAINTTCLSANRGITTITGHQCGNGIVEDGEDCDCGGEESCTDDPCCEAKTCKFKAGAVCDDANEDCCKNCQFASAGTICRPSTGSCDPQEVCPGNSGICPTDTNAPDGQKCSIPSNSSTQGIDLGDLECASGQCTSRDLQCRTVMGAYTHDNNTYACDSKSCTMSCASPAFGPNACYGLQQNLLDGTPCGGGGHCENGQCKGSTVGKEVGNWVEDHRNLVIGIACAIGGLLLLSFLTCVYSSCRRRSRQRKFNKMNGRQPNSGSGWVGMPPPGPGMPAPLMMQQRGGPQAPRSMPGDLPGAWRPPPPPPPQYGWAGPSPYGGGQSMRYA